MSVCARVTEFRSLEVERVLEIRVRKKSAWLSKVFLSYTVVVIKIYFSFHL